MDPKAENIIKIELDFGATVAGWKTTLFNCECHTFDDVIGQLIKATGCSAATAAQLANIVHNSGSAVVYRGIKADCERVAGILSSIGLVTSVGW